MASDCEYLGLFFGDFCFDLDSCRTCPEILADYVLFLLGLSPGQATNAYVHCKCDAPLKQYVLDWISGYPTRSFALYPDDSKTMGTEIVVYQGLAFPQNYSVTAHCDRFENLIGKPPRCGPQTFHVTACVQDTHLPSTNDTASAELVLYTKELPAPTIVCPEDLTGEFALCPYESTSPEHTGEPTCDVFCTLTPVTCELLRDITSLYDCVSQVYDKKDARCLRIDRTFQVVDACGQSQTCDQVISVIVGPPCFNCTSLACCLPRKKCCRRRQHKHKKCCGSRDSDHEGSGSDDDQEGSGEDDEEEEGSDSDDENNWHGGGGGWENGGSHHHHGRSHGCCGSGSGGGSGGGHNHNDGGDGGDGEHRELRNYCDLDSRDPDILKHLQLRDRDLIQSTATDGCGGHDVTVSSRDYDACFNCVRQERVIARVWSIRDKCFDNIENCREKLHRHQTKCVQTLRLRNQCWENYFPSQCPCECPLSCKSAKKFLCLDYKADREEFC